MDHDQLCGVQCLGKIKQFFSPFEDGECTEYGIYLAENIGCIYHIGIGSHIFWDCPSCLKSLIPSDSDLLKLDIQIFGEFNSKGIVDGRIIRFGKPDPYNPAFFNFLGISSAGRFRQEEKTQD